MNSRVGICEGNFGRFEEGILNLTRDTNDLKKSSTQTTSSLSEIQKLIEQLKMKSENDRRFSELQEQTSALSDVVSNLKLSSNSSIQSTNVEIGNVRSLVETLYGTVNTLSINTSTSNESFLSKLSELRGIIETMNSGSVDESKLNELLRPTNSRIDDLSHRLTATNSGIDELKSSSSGYNLLFNEIQRKIDELSSRSSDSSSQNSRLMQEIQKKLDALTKGSNDSSSQNSSLISELQRKYEDLSKTSFDTSLTNSSMFSEIQRKIESLTGSGSSSSNQDPRFDDLLKLINELKDKPESDSSQRVNELIIQMENIIEQRTEGSSGPLGPMRWLNNYDCIGGNNNPLVTSIYDDNENAVLTIGNTTTFAKGTKTLGKSEAKSAKFGYGPSVGTQNQFALDVKGDSNFDGKINGTAVTDLGRTPKVTQNISVLVGTVYNIQYTGSFPNRVRVLFNNTTEVPISSTDGYLYSINRDSITIRTGTNSIATTFDRSGKLKTETSGSYTVQIF